MQRIILSSLVFAILGVLAPRPALAHCDTMDGPVVKAAQRALETSDVRVALVWVMPAGEAEVRDAFARTLKVRDLGPDARALADRAFFETLVRVHRAGEGEPFTGLKPAGTEADPAVHAADHALETASLAELDRLVRSAVSDGLRERFEAALAARAAAKPGDVDSGRHAVAAYVAFIHYAEAVHAAAAGHHAAEAGH